MTFDYTSLRDNVAQPLIKDFGVTGALFIPGADTGEPFDPQPAADTVQPIIVVQTTFTKEDREGGNVEVNDVAFLASTEGVLADPSMADRLQVAGVLYQIVDIKPLRPGPVVMLWKIHARK